MMNLESELKPVTAESSYIRVIVWDAIPNSEDIQDHFNKFNLLQLKQKQLRGEKLDIIEINETTYERFLYAYFSDQQRTVTIFIKVNFNSKRDSYSMKNFIERVHTALKKHGLNDNDVIVHDQIRSNNSTSWNTCITLTIVIITLLLITNWKNIRRLLPSFYNKIKNMDCVNYNRKKHLKELPEHKEKFTNQQQSFIPYHPDLAMTFYNKGRMYENMNNHLEAISYYKEVLAIQNMQFPPNYPRLAMTYYKIGIMYENMNKHRDAVLFFEHAIQFSERSLPESYPNLADYRNSLERAKKKL